MLKAIARKLLPWCVKILYSSDKSRKDFIRKVNNETWIGSQIGSGGHSLGVSKPIGNEEVVSIMCVLANNRTYIGDDAKFKEIDYYTSEWTD
jgi:hypothetical protein